MTATAIDGREPIFRARGLNTWFPIRKGVLRRLAGHIRAVDGVDLELHKGETLGLVGESGCGKSTLVQTILRLIPPTSGTVEYLGGESPVDLLSLPRGEMARFRRRIQVVFQDPTSSMSPRLSIREIVGEPLRVQGIASGAELTRRVAGLLDSVGMDPAAMNRYPASFSGGQRQRIGIARALALEPEILILDEPVSALDVSVQAQILNLLKQLKAERNLTYLFIAHHLDVVRYMSDRIAVMYLGRIVEVAETDRLYRKPLHPYTASLLGAIPAAHPSRRGTGTIAEGDLPDPAAPPPGCAFHARCPFATEICSREDPPLRSRGPGHEAACHHAGELELGGRSG